ncbi:hypothetical protein GY45DRAFT_1367013 [Cubamyces sp. BRFM 1775]|nr:hypothetical protein GY45DRAFT_1367013 [Cubamyces sp. BRFM 1775]
MPNQQIESAAVTRLASVSPKLLSRKLRVAGWLLHHDTETSTIMIHDGADALLVDVSLCLSPYTPSPWLRESRTIVMVLGYLESSEKAIPLPVLPAHAPIVDVNPRLVLRAIVAEEARDLDMALWNKAIQAQEECASRARGPQKNEDDE